MIAALRFDGLYCAPRGLLYAGSERRKNFTHYFQFFRNGHVETALSSGSPEQVANWLYKCGLAAGVYSVSGDSLVMTVEVPELNGAAAITYEYSGRVLSDKLLLYAKSFSNYPAAKTEQDIEATFVPIDGVSG